ncbi:hypothetical protein ACOMHN_046944 [Nucella lapillus]
MMCMKNKKDTTVLNNDLHISQVEQRRAMRSRRQRTLNRRYLSEEFTSIFTENRHLAPHLGFCQPSATGGVGERVELDAPFAMDDGEGALFFPDMEVQEECVVETETVQDTIEIASEDVMQKPAESDHRGRRSSRVSSPYSDISDESHSSRSSSLSSSSSSSSVRSMSRRRQRRRSSDDSSDSDDVVLKSSSQRRGGSWGDCGGTRRSR